MGKISNQWEYVAFCDAVDICDTQRKPINSKERSKRIAGKPQSELYPYYGATGQVGYIDDYITDGEYVLLGEDGAPFLDVFAPKAYVISGKAWVNNHAHVLRSKKSNKFLCYYLNYFNYKGFVSGTTRLKLTQNSMKQIKIPNPPLSEQERIVARIEELFSQLDDGVEALKKIKQQLAVYRQAVLKKAFDGILTGVKPYEVKVLGEYIEQPRYGTSKKCSYDVANGLTPVYRIPNIDYATGRINHDDIKRAVLTEHELEGITLKEGDILIIRSNGSVSLVGRAAMVYDIDIKGSFAGYLMRLRIKNVEKVKPKYLLWFLQSHSARIYIESKAKSTSGVHNINSKEISRLQIPLFSQAEQTQIIQAIESRLSVCDSIEQAVDSALWQAEAMRRSILKCVFEGRL